MCNLIPTCHYKPTMLIIAAAGYLRPHVSLAHPAGLFGKSIDSPASGALVAAIDVCLIARAEFSALFFF